MVDNGAVGFEKFLEQFASEDCQMRKFTLPRVSTGPSCEPRIDFNPMIDRYIIC
jgi:hypothetical protein